MHIKRTLRALCDLRSTSVPKGGRDVTSRGQGSTSATGARPGRGAGDITKDLPACLNPIRPPPPEDEKVETLDLTPDHFSQINWIIQPCETIREPPLADTVSFSFHAFNKKRETCNVKCSLAVPWRLPTSDEERTRLCLQQRFAMHQMKACSVSRRGAPCGGSF